MILSQRVEQLRINVGSRFDHEFADDPENEKYCDRADPKYDYDMCLDFQGHQTLKINKFVIHKNYRRVQGVLYNDIALIQLKPTNSAKFNFDNVINSRFRNAFKMENALFMGQQYNMHVSIRMLTSLALAKFVKSVAGEIRKVKVDMYSSLQNSFKAVLSKFIISLTVNENMEEV